MTVPNSNHDPCAAAFDTAFADLAPALACRPERADDAAFLTALFAACSPLAGLLPEAMMAAQAGFKEAAHAAAYPSAMRRIVMLDDAAIGRLAIDWAGPGTHCIDVAVLPEYRATGAGPLLLRAWLAVADAHARPATLEVAADNPAARLYERLGFAPAASDGVTIAMTRPIGVPPAG